PAQTAKTMIHEVAHAIMHADITYADYIAHRGIRETEAESVAYIVEGTLGLDTSADSVGYVAQWSECDTELIKATAKRVIKASHQIRAAITEDEQHDKQAAKEHSLIGKQENYQEGQRPLLGGVGLLFLVFHRHAPDHGVKCKHQRQQNLFSRGRRLPCFVKKLLLLLPYGLTPFSWRVLDLITRKCPQIIAPA